MFEVKKKKNKWAPCAFRHVRDLKLVKSKLNLKSKTRKLSNN